MNRLAIIVISWNNSDDAIECMESLAVQTRRGLTILCIDNASTDPSNSQKLQRFIANHPNNDIRFIQSDVNNGTAGGFNIGVKWAIENNYDFIGTLNADAIADKNWVKTLEEEIETNANIGLVTGKLLRRDGKTIDTTGDFYTTWGIPGPRLRDKPANKAPKEPGFIFGCSGGSFLARTAMFGDIGLFDEKYFMYYEDVDISFRAQLGGYKARYTPNAVAFHKLGASSGTVPGLAVYQTFKNLPMLYLKNVPKGLFWHVSIRFCLTYALIFGNALVHGSGWPALKGLAVSIKNIPHSLVERRRIQSSKKVNANYISGILLHDIPPEQTGMRKFRKFFTGIE